MAQFAFVKSQGGMLAPATPDAADFLRNRVRLGDVIHADFKKVRNPAFHRKYFSLLNLGFEYWQPTGGTISPVEKLLVRGFARFLAYYAGGNDALDAAADEYLTTVGRKRAANISGVKSFEAFRHWATVEAGYFDAYEMPNGAILKTPRSISFAKMDDIEFNEVYRSTLDVLWNFILSKTFSSQLAVENAAAQLMSYA